MSAGARAIGVDIGGSSVKVSGWRHDGRFIDAHSEPYEHPAADAIRAMIAAALRRANLTAGEAGCPVGLCAPGLISDSGVVVRSLNMPGLEGVGLRELAGAALAEAGIRAPVAAGGGRPGLTLTTDARAAGHDVWCERRQPGRMCVLSIGTGVGLCVLDAGLPLRLTGETPGHFGHVEIAEGLTIEGAVGARALGSRLGPDWADRLGPDDAAVAMLARGLRILHALYRPDEIVLAGGVGVVLARVAPRLRAITERGLTPLARAEWALGFASHGYCASRGAARLALGASGADGGELAGH